MGHQIRRAHSRTLRAIHAPRNIKRHKPILTNTNTGTIPPCISITTIQSLCAPNGTAPLDYLASAECMCDPPSSFFADWQGCQQCLFVHGARSQQEMDTYSSIIALASAALCTGTPTASFAAIFSSVAATLPPASSDATALSDAFPSQTAVSLYYTTSGSQGIGAITGSATAATEAASACGSSGVGASGVTTLTGTHSSNGSATTGSATTSGSASTGATSSSSSAGAATGAASLEGVVAAVGLIAGSMFLDGSL